MILFKRVNESFGQIESREWALLFLETVSVVAGILIAFELNEWATRRADDARHHQLMERLLEESELDVLVLRQWRQDINELTEPEKAFAVSISKGECPGPEAWNSVNTLSMLPAISAPTSVYEELMGAGGLASIPRQSTRRSIAQFHGTLDWTQKQIDYFREARIEVLSPSDKRVRVSFDPTQREPEVWTFDRGALCADTSVRNRIASATRAHVTYARYVEALASAAVEMCAAVGETIGKSCSPQDGALTGEDLKAAQNAIAQMRKTGH